MQVFTARHLSNIPHAAVIYGQFTQPFGPDVAREDAWERLAIIIEHNGPNAYCGGDVADDLADELLEGLDFPNDGCEITFYLYATEE
jgi:hypothetical protein